MGGEKDVLLDERYQYACSPFCEQRKLKKLGIDVGDLYLLKSMINKKGPAEARPIISLVIELVEMPNSNKLPSRQAQCPFKFTPR